MCFLWWPHTHCEHVEKQISNRAIDRVIKTGLRISKIMDEDPIRHFSHEWLTIIRRALGHYLGTSNDAAEHGKVAHKKCLFLDAVTSKDANHLLNDVPVIADEYTVNRLRGNGESVKRGSDNRKGQKG